MQGVKQKVWFTGYVPWCIFCSKCMFAFWFLTQSEPHFLTTSLWRQKNSKKWKNDMLPPAAGANCHWHEPYEGRRRRTQLPLVSNELLILRSWDERQFDDEVNIPCRCFISSDCLLYYSWIVDIFGVDKSFHCTTAAFRYRALLLWQWQHHDQQQQKK